MADLHTKVAVYKLDRIIETNNDGEDGLSWQMNNVDKYVEEKRIKYKWEVKRRRGRDWGILQLITYVYIYYII